VPPGYRAYVVLGCGAGVAVGLLAAAVTQLTIPVATAAWTGVGALYGLLLWAAAHHGYLPFVEP
jgi:multidrug transporter EmrE-like cation transporter